MMNQRNVRLNHDVIKFIDIETHFSRARIFKKEFLSFSSV